MAPQGAPAPNLAQGFTLMLSQGQVGLQALVNQQAQMMQLISKNVQQAQVNVLSTLNSFVMGPFATLARPPMLPLQAMQQGGEGVTPMDFFPEQYPAAVREKTQRQVPYYPLTEQQRDFSAGGMTAAPQQEIPFPAPAETPAARAKTEFF